MTRVLLTGAGGFIGGHTLEHFLINTDWEMVCTDSFKHRGKTDRLRQVMDRFTPEQQQRVTVLTHDLTAPISDQLAHAFGDIDYIISMASESHVDRSITDPRDFVVNNVEVILTMLEYARQHPVKKFLQISTDEVYGTAAEGEFHKEGEPHRPSNPYSASKAAQEDICHSYWRTYGIPIAITNTMNIIGERQDCEKFVPMIISKVNAGEEVPIHASKDGVPGTRFYLHARNQADALLFLLKNVDFPTYAEGVELERFNILGEREVSNLEMAELVAKYAGKELKPKFIDFHSSRPGHDLRYALDGSKMRNAGWRAPLSLEESLERTVKWTLGHPEWLQ